MQKRQYYAANQDGDLTLTAHPNDCKHNVIWDFTFTTHYFSINQPFAG